jgi:hypothetical protein
MDGKKNIKEHTHNIYIYQYILYIY